MADAISTLVAWLTIIGFSAVCVFIYRGKRGLGAFWLVLLAPLWLYGGFVDAIVTAATRGAETIRPDGEQSQPTQRPAPNEPAKPDTPKPPKEVKVSDAPSGKFGGLGNN